MKAILVILDGLADRAQAELDNKTPLEAANTPHLNYLCSKAETGIMIPYRQGIPMGTETAHFVLFGYDLKDFPGRGAIEALGEGALLREDEVYLRTCFSFVEKGSVLGDGFRVKNRYTQELTTGEIMELAESLPPSIKGISIKWKHSFDVHGILTLRGDSISSSISDSDPFSAGKHVMKIEPFESAREDALFTAKLLNDFLVKSYETLKNHPVNINREIHGKEPANFILTKWAGHKAEIPDFSEKHGMTSLMIGASGLLKGLAKYLGMDFIKCADFEQAVRQALQANHDFIHVHTKEPDDAAHTKKPDNKVKVIEKLDRALKPLLENEETFKDDTLLVITADHSTPSSGTMIHSGEPVPIMFLGKGIRFDDVSSFGERSCTKGSIRMQGFDLMPMILSITDRGLLYGLRQGGKRKMYVPDEGNPLLP